MNNSRKLQLVAIAVAIAASTALSTHDSFAAARTRQADKATRRAPASELKARVANALIGIRFFLQGTDEQWEAPSGRVYTKK